MTALIAEKAGSVREITRAKRPLAANVKVFKGGLAVCIVGVGATSRGYYKQGAAGEQAVVVGRYTETIDNTGGADGALSAEIHFLRERHVFLCVNDAGTAVAVADRESECGVLDDQTVTQGVTGSARAGIVYDVTTEGVWVEFDHRQIPNIQKGTGTLVTGTLTVTGVKLTAGSIISLTMRDPGAGALTTFIALDAPVASRNTGTGQFVVNAIDNAKAVLATAVSTFDWTITG